MLALNNAPFVLFVVLFVGFGLFSERFLQWQNLRDILTQASYIGIVAVGMTFVLLTGGIDLSVGANMYLSAVVAGVLIRDGGVPVPLGLASCLCVGLLFGGMNAFLVTKVKVIPFMATLATMVAGRGLGLFLTKSEPLAFPERVLAIGSVSLFGVVPFPMVIFAAVVLASQLFLSGVPRGRQLYAVGHDREAADKAGIPSDRVLATAYMVCGFLAALGGFVSVAQLGNVNSGFGEFDEFDAIAAAVLGGASLFGGIGTVFPGTVLGVILIQMVAVGLVAVQVNLYAQPMLEAGIIFLAVFLDSLRNRLLARLYRRPIGIEAG